MRIKFGSENFILEESVGIKFECEDFIVGEIVLGIKFEGDK